MTLGDKYNTLSPILKMWLLRLREVNTFLKATQLIIGISITVECVFLSSKAGLSQNLKPYISILPIKSELTLQIPVLIEMIKSYLLINPALDF